MIRIFLSKPQYLALSPEIAVRPMRLPKSAIVSSQEQEHLQFCPYSQKSPSLLPTAQV
jgi:hypothetical protein